MGVYAGLRTGPRRIRIALELVVMCRTEYLGGLTICGISQCMHWRLLKASCPIRPSWQAPKWSAFYCRHPPELPLARREVLQAVDIILPGVGGGHRMGDFSGLLRDIVPPRPLPSRHDTNAWLRFLSAIIVANSREVSAAKYRYGSL
jgi:hypothetical protein